MFGRKAVQNYEGDFVSDGFGDGKKRVTLPEVLRRAEIS
jgi:hypothetical protein